MGIYTARDIYQTASGDLAVSSNGDIRLGTSLESVSGSVNFILRTDRGGYRPDKRIGANFGSFIGERMTRDVITDMENSAISNITDWTLDRSDLQLRIFPLSNEEAGVVTIIAGTYIDSDGNVMDVNPTVVNYVYPYLEGEPNPAT